MQRGKNLFTSLSVDIILQFFIGVTAVVPFIPVHKHMRKRKHFEANGRILTHTVALLQYVPARLSRCTLLCLSLDSSHISNELLLSEMRYYSWLGYESFVEL